MTGWAFVSKETNRVWFDEALRGWSAFYQEWTFDCLNWVQTGKIHSVKTQLKGGWFTSQTSAVFDGCCFSLQTPWCFARTTDTGSQHPRDSKAAWNPCVQNIHTYIDPVPEDDHQEWSSESLVQRQVSLSWAAIKSCMVWTVTPLYLPANFSVRFLCWDSEKLP